LIQFTFISLFQLFFYFFNFQFFFDFFNFLKFIVFIFRFPFSIFSNVFLKPEKHELSNEKIEIEEKTYIKIS